MNRDEALKCVALSYSALQKGDQKRALKLAQKSLRMCDTPEGQAMLRKVQSSSAHTSSSSSSSTTHRRPAAAAAAAARPASAPVADIPLKKYTAEQASEVKKYMGIKDYYKLLGVPKNADSAAMKRAFRKLAVKFHPDKNTAPNATDVFKKISNAYEVLKDDEKRKSYDTFGPDGPQMASQRGGHQQGFHPSMGPDDLFDMFFGDDRRRYRRNPRANFFHQRTRRDHAQHRQGGGGAAAGNPLMAQLVQALPLILVMLFALLNGIGNSEEPFSMSPTRSHFLKRVTPNYRVPYYVTRSFDRQYARDHRGLYYINARVEEQYVEKLKKTCETERVKQKKLFRTAKKSSRQAREALLDQARSMELPSCARLEEILQGA
jgi:curved DNA-binding protein CbpA